MLVPKLVSGQIQGGVASGIGLGVARISAAVRGRSRGRHLEFQPLSSAAWQRRGGVDADRRDLAPLSDSEPPKGMAEVVSIPIMAAILNGIAHAIGHRFRSLPVTPDQILGVLT